MYHSSVTWEITLLYFFSWNVIWFGLKEPIKVQNFRLLTAHMTFHQICTFIGPFYWKCIKFQLKKYRGVMSHDTEDWYKIEGKLIFCVKNDKNLVNYDLSTGDSRNFCFDWFLFCKIYDIWHEKYMGVIFHDCEEWCKIWRKTDLRFGKWHEEYGKFSAE